MASPRYRGDDTDHGNSLLKMGLPVAYCRYRMEGMKSVTLTKVTIAVYAVSLSLTWVLALLGQLGSLSPYSVTGWVLAGWLAGYATLGVLLVGGTLHWILKDALPLISKQLNRSCE